MDNSGIIPRSFFFIPDSEKGLQILQIGRFGSDKRFHESRHSAAGSSQMLIFSYKSCVCVLRWNIETTKRNGKRRNSNLITLWKKIMKILHFTFING